MAEPVPRPSAGYFVHGMLGYAVIVLTNDPRYWKPAGASTASDSAFRIHDGAVLKNLCGWGKIPAGKERRQSIKISRPYEMRWSEFSNVDGQALLWQLVVEVPETGFRAS